jgi:hypothetical protein
MESFRVHARRSIGRAWVNPSTTRTQRTQKGRKAHHLENEENASYFSASYPSFLDFVTLKGASGIEDGINERNILIIRISDTVCINGEAGDGWQVTGRNDSPYRMMLEPFLCVKNKVQVENRWIYNL